MKKQKVFPLIAAVALACVMACSLAACRVSKADKDTLRFVGTDYAGGNLDPSYMDNAAWQLERLGIGETLFRLDAHGKAQPWLAKSCRVNADQSRWVITLKPNVRFSNGRKLTASGAKAAIDRMFANEKAKKGTTTPSTYLNPTAIAADDAAGTLTIATDPAQYVDVPAALAHPDFCIIDTASKTDVSSRPVGTGPYVVTAIKTKKSYTLKKNKHYWDGPVPYKHVIFTCSDDASAKALALQSGDQDVAENLTTAADLNTLKNDRHYRVKEVQAVRTGFTYLNLRSGHPLANKALRLALCTATDNRTICRKTVGGLYTPGIGILPTVIDYGSKDVKDPTPYSLKKAKAILDKAGIKDTDKDGWRELNGKNISLTYLTFSGRNLPEFAEAQTDFFKRIGIRCTVKKTDADTHWNKLVAGDFDLANLTWNVMQSGDPQGFMANFTSGAENNYGKYASGQYDSLYAQLKTTKNTAARRQLFTRLQQILKDDAAVIVGGYYKTNICWSENVTGVTYLPVDYYWITKDIKPAS
ncbi:ABC transporter substrate-binding protein [Pseudoramibacter alactolyticus]|uniref:ABC transporter substrate-binding protein n=3 Tax=Pseudoramibacter alactolyticus TaxID=113287 RepID=UPI0028F02FEB|nr:ABC transporter substrate-binding protein [Pseudoramibacter alactolyticus]